MVPPNTYRLNSQSLLWAGARKIAGFLEKEIEQSK